MGRGQRRDFVSVSDVARACRLAHRLRREGVGPEVRVGVLLEKSVEAVVAFWGVQKAGGVYVPLEAVLPRERLAQVGRLRDACDDVRRTEAGLVLRFPADAELYVRPLVFGTDGFLVPVPEKSAFALTLFDAPMPAFTRTASIEPYIQPAMSTASRSSPSSPGPSPRSSVSPWPRRPWWRACTGP